MLAPDDASTCVPPSKNPKLPLDLDHFLFISAKIQSIPEILYHQIFLSNQLRIYSRFLCVRSRRGCIDASEIR